MNIFQQDYFSTSFVESLNTELNKMLDAGTIQWHEHHKQICINTPKTMNMINLKAATHIGTGLVVQTGQMVLTKNPRR